MAEESPSEFGTKKTDYLNQCIRMTEDILSSSTDFEKIQLLIQQRGEIILQLDGLEKLYGKTVTASEIAKADQLVDLLQKLNVQAVKMIKKEQQEILAAMKVNIKEHKLVAYNPNSSSSSGRLLDKKR